MLVLDLGRAWASGGLAPTAALTWEGVWSPRHTPHLPSARENGLTATLSPSQ